MTASASAISWRCAASASSAKRRERRDGAVPAHRAARGRGEDGEFWALHDVSLRGRGRRGASAIIGRNGAGKSTLLKILSRITEPTAGRVELRGRVASLLEVGTGFHPELTGRENIFLNGAILGMKRAEIRRKFDEIVAFAEVERFIDTPVKRYSSGMYVRLAFAVAAHLEPRDPDRRRSARGRRRGVPAEVHRQDAGGGPRRTDGAVRQRTTCPRPSAGSASAVLLLDGRSELARRRAGYKESLQGLP